MMQIVKEREDYLEITISDVDVSIASSVAEYLNMLDGVEYAGYRVEHPLTGNITLVVKTRPEKIKARDAVKEAISNLKAVLSKLNEEVDIL